MEFKNHTEGEPDLKNNLMENGHALENRSNGELLGAKGQDACRRFKKHIAIVIGTVLLILGSLIGNIFQAVQIKKLQAAACPSNGCFNGWSRHGDRCYFFSDVHRSWDFSHRNCSSFGASLVTLYSKEEWDLIKSKKEEYWIDLRREKADQLWRWPDGSNVTQSEVKGTGFCGYVSDDRISSTNCDNTRHWVCWKRADDA